MLAFKSASFTVERLELLDLFTLKTRNTVACENLVGLLGLLTMDTRAKHTFTCENENGLLDLLNMGFKNLDSEKGLRGSGMGLLARGIFTFKSKTSSEREAFAWV